MVNFGLVVCVLVLVGFGLTLWYIDLGGLACLALLFVLVVVLPVVFACCD